MAGFHASGVLLNVLLSLAMMFGRFLPMSAALAISGHAGIKQRTASSAGTLATDTVLFGLLLIFVVILVGALSFIPSLALGPLAQMTGSM